MLLRAKIDGLFPDASGAEYALYFRDASLERREIDGSGLHTMPKRATQPLKVLTPEERALSGTGDEPRTGRMSPMGRRSGDES